MAGSRPKRPNTVKAIRESTSRFGQLTYLLRTQTFIPAGGRKDEKGFLKARTALCLVPAFRLEIQALRKRYAGTYWAQGQQADRDAQECAEKWRVTESQMILWLVQHWDPSQPNSPPIFPTFSMSSGLVKLLGRLCRTSAFQDDVQRLRECYPASYWVQGHKLSSEAEQLCDRWGIEGVHWVIWLVQHWDPDLADLPPFEPRDRLDLLPVLRNWVLTIDSIIDDAEKGSAGKPLRATLTLYPGASLRDVRAAGQIALQQLEPSTKRKGARPGLTDIDRTVLREEFEKLGIPAHRTRTRMVRMVADRMKQHGRPMSESVIAHELRVWLHQKGEPVKQYYSEKQDSRS